MAVHAGTAALWFQLNRALAGLREVDLRLHTGPQATIVFDRTGRVLHSYHLQNRIDVPLDEMAPAALAAILAAEDRRYYEHRGLDPIRILGAAWENLRAGRIVEGGSTITQQVVRTVSLDRSRTIERKLKEMYLAAELEERNTKREILQTYLNAVYFGSGYYGIEAAARGYFGVRASELDAAQAALLAGLVRAPSALTPRLYPERALARRQAVLRAMAQAGALTPAEHAAFSERPLGLAPEGVSQPVGAATDRTASAGAVPYGRYFKALVREQLVHLFGFEAVYKNGLRVQTTLDPGLQREAERAVREHIASLEARLGRNSRGEGGDDPLQGALVSLDPRSGEVLALVGGRRFEASPFDRATQARRQPGSAFKPLIFAAALENGLSPGTVLSDLDAPIPAHDGEWLPDGEHEAASYTLRRALIVSSNRAAARLLQEVGVARAIDLAARLGIESELPPVPSLALGTGEVTLLELTSAYAVFANGGVRVAPVVIRRVTDSGGRVIWQNRGEARRVLTRETAFLVSHMLADVVDRGTGHAVRAAGLTGPLAGKTGTSDDFTDAWFVGYTPSVTTGVWFGYDRPRTIMKRGFASVVAVPAWTAFMKAATAGHEPQWYQEPSTLRKVALCRVTGQRATRFCREAAAGELVAYIVDEHGGIEVLPDAGIVEDYFVSTFEAPPCQLHDPDGVPLYEGHPVHLVRAEPRNDGYRPADPWPALQ